MNRALEAILQQQFGLGCSDLIVRTITPMPGGADRFGNFVSAREDTHQVYLRRLKHVQRLQPPRPDLVARCRLVVDALEATFEQEDLFSWHVVFGGRSFTGVSTLTRRLFCLPF